jgi:hypothetical protein
MDEFAFSYNDPFYFEKGLLGPSMSLPQIHKFLVENFSELLTESDISGSFMRLCQQNLEIQDFDFGPECKNWSNLHLWVVSLAHSLRYFSRSFIVLWKGLEIRYQDPEEVLRQYAFLGLMLARSAGFRLRFFLNSFMIMSLFEGSCKKFQQEADFYKNVLNLAMIGNLFSVNQCPLASALISDAENCLYVSEWKERHQSVRFTSVWFKEAISDSETVAVYPSVAHMSPSQFYTMKEKAQNAWISGYHRMLAYLNIRQI